MVRPLVIVGACALLGLAACGEDAPPAPDSTSSAPREAPSGHPAGGGNEADQGRPRDEPTGITVIARGSQFGEILFDEDDRAIYLFDAEQGATPECYDECAVAWPPVLTKGDPRAAGGADSKLLGTTEREDGSTQVTYDGHPLYYYVDDPPGEVLCNDVEEFGGLWLVLDAEGNPVSA